MNLNECILMNFEWNEFLMNFELSSQLFVKNNNLVSSNFHFNNDELINNG